MKSNSIFRLFHWAALLVGGFFIGTAWKNKVVGDVAPQISADGNPYNTNEDQQESDKNHDAQQKELLR